MIFEAEAVTGQIITGVSVRDEGFYSWLGDGRGRETKVYPDSIRILVEDEEEIQ